MVMTSSKKEISGSAKELKISKKARYKKLMLWLMIDLAVAAIIFTLLLYKPRMYQPVVLIDQDSQNKYESRYLTNELLPRITDYSQKGKPFQVVITQEGLNDIITHSNWPIESEGVLLYAPAAVILPGAVILMGTADLKGVKFIVTIELELKINEQGLMNFSFSKLKVGAMNLTPVAKMIAKKMYEERLAAYAIEQTNILAKIAGSLFNDEPFEPAFEIDKNRLRITQITTEKGKLTALLSPALKNSR
jgi:hypothetical protein